MNDHVNMIKEVKNNLLVDNDNNNINRVKLTETSPTDDVNIFESRKQNFDTRHLTDTKQTITKDQFLSIITNYSGNNDATV